MKIGKRIRHYREKKGLTQRELAKLIHVSERTVGNYETNTRTPHLEMISVIAKALDIKTEDLVRTFEEEILKGIPKKIESYELYEHFWLFDYDEENEIPVLKDEILMKNNKEEFVRTKVGKDLVFIPVMQVERIISLEDMKEETVEYDEGIHLPITEVVPSQKIWAVFIRIKETENGYERIALSVDSVNDVSKYNRTCEEENQYILEKKRREVEEIKLLLTNNLLASDADYMKCGEIKSFTYHIKEFIIMTGRGFSNLIVQTKVNEIKDAYRKITNEIKKQQEVTSKENRMVREVVKQEHRKLRESGFSEDAEWKSYSYEEMIALVEKYAKELMSKKSD